jgi:hypothetical protein
MSATRTQHSKKLTEKDYFLNVDGNSLFRLPKRVTEIQASKILICVAQLD